MASLLHRALFASLKIACSRTTTGLILLQATCVRADNNFLFRTKRDHDPTRTQALAGSIVALKCNDFLRTNDVTCSLIQDHNAFVVARRNVGIDDSQ